VKRFLVSLIVSSFALAAVLIPTASALAAPANDNFASAQVVGPALPISEAGTTVGATVEAGEKDPGDGHSVWFSWTAPGAGPVRVDVCDYKVVSGPGNSGLWVYTGNSIATLVEVGSSPNGCKVSFPAIGGTTYRISFNSFFEGEGTFTLRLSAETPPPNDNFSSAQAVGPDLPISLTGSNVSSTVEAGEPHHGSNDEVSFPAHDSVWYTWTPQTTTDARIRACDGSFGPHLGVYTGAALGALTKVTPTDPINTFPFCSIRFQAQQGITYRIAIGGFGAEEEGQFQLDIHGFSPPANDNVASAGSIGPDLPISIEGSNIDASAEEGEPDHSQFDEGDAFESVWYSWISTTARVVRVSTCGAGFSSYLAIYTGPAEVESLTKVGVGKGGCGPAGGHLIEFSALAGVRYLIAVAGTSVDREGTFPLSIVDPAMVPPGPPPPPASETQLQRTGFSLKNALKKCRKIQKRKPRRRCVRRARRKAKKMLSAA
jgi:hypothetical protein